MTRLLIILMALGIPVTLWAAPSLPEIDRYRAIYQLLESSEGPRSMAPLFDAALSVQTAALDLGDNQRAWLERLSNEEAAELQDTLPGLILHRGYEVHVEIDGDAMLALANEKGKPVDQAFFQRFVAAYNDQALPVYMDFTSGLSPCIRFDQPTLIIDQYREWRKFRQEHPDAYSSFVDQWIRDIEDVIAHGTCTCTQEQAPVEKTLARFVEEFPQTPVREKTLARLQQLNEQPDEKPVWCR